MLENRLKTSRSHYISDLIHIGNDGGEIVETNYFSGEMSEFLFLSFNGGAARLLIPDSYVDEIPEMLRGVKDIVITYSKVFNHKEARGENGAYEILFDDHSSNPYVIYIPSQQSDRILSLADSGQELDFFMVTSEGGCKQLDILCRFRIASEVPCLLGWEDGKKRSIPLDKY